MRATSVSARARLASMPSGWNHHAGRPARRSGRGGSSEPEVGTGRRLAELVAQPGPLAHGLAAGDPLGQDRRQQGVVEVAAGAGADAGEAAGGLGDAGGGGRAAAPAGGRRRSSPRRARGRGRRPVPRRRCAAGRDQSTTTVAGPSGVQQARAMPVGAQRGRRVAAPVAVPRQRPRQVDRRPARRGVRRRRRPGVESANGGRHRPGTYQQRRGRRGRPRRHRAPDSAAAGATGHHRGHERHRDLASQARRRADHPQPPERLNAMTSELVDRPARRARRHRRRPGGPRRRSSPAPGGASAPASTSSGFGDPPHSDHLGPTQRGFAMQRLIANLIPQLRSLPQPVIAAVNGPAAGGGFALVLGSDIRIAARTARFNAAFIRIGLSACDIGTSWLLPRLVGVARAQELMLTGPHLRRRGGLPHRPRRRPRRRRRAARRRPRQGRRDHAQHARSASP